MAFEVSVSKEYLGFAAAHFLTFRGHRCESLHGHNYRVAVTVAGDPDPECHFVIDFAILKDAVSTIVKRLDHHVLLAATNPKLAIDTNEGMTFVRYLDTQTYQFPAADCVLLPIANTTAELLSEWLAGQLVASLSIEPPLMWVEVEVEESPGQSARFRRSFDRD